MGHIGVNLKNYHKKSIIEFVEENSTKIVGYKFKKDGKIKCNYYPIKSGGGILICDDKLYLEDVKSINSIFLGKLESTIEESLKLGTDTLGDFVNKYKKNHVETEKIK
ncbi:MAG: hypothetical protein KKF48_00055 [Nanoarchaeota archaeon]|nr:hypothetical protein [Nanoarchaeota archaeon]MBU1027416.1 hypothetical protein [Nanoarchaeota archaeon]